MGPPTDKSNETKHRGAEPNPSGLTESQGVSIHGTEVSNTLHLASCSLPGSRSLLKSGEYTPPLFLVSSFFLFIIIASASLHQHFIKYSQPELFSYYILYSLYTQSYDRIYPLASVTVSCGLQPTKKIASYSYPTIRSSIHPHDSIGPWIYTSTPSNRPIIPLAFGLPRDIDKIKGAPLISRFNTNFISSFSSYLPSPFSLLFSFFPIQ